MEIKLLLKDYFKSDINNFIQKTPNVYSLEVCNKKYILKLVSAKCIKINSFLVQENIDIVSLPFKKFKTKKGVYFLYEYQVELDIPNQTKAKHLLELTNLLHDKTKYEKKLSSKNFKYLYRTYKKIDYKFQMLEMYIRESEIKNNKNDCDWILLSKYHVFLDAKIVMYNLQKKIHDYIDKKTNVLYSLNHGNPNISHIYNNKLISMDSSYLGLFVSDIAKLYINCDHINIDWYTLINEVLSKYDNEFYKIYFKFMVLYIYMINVDLNVIDLGVSSNKYIQISRKISIFLQNFESYQ